MVINFDHGKTRSFPTLYNVFLWDLHVYTVAIKKDEDKTKNAWDDLCIYQFCTVAYIMLLL